MLRLVSHGEYAEGTDRQTDGRTPDRYITLSAMDAASVMNSQNGVEWSRISTTSCGRQFRFRVQFKAENFAASIGLQNGWHTRTNPFFSSTINNEFRAVWRAIPAY